MFEIKPLRGIALFSRILPRLRNISSKPCQAASPLFDYNNDGLLDIFWSMGAA